MMSAMNADDWLRERTFHHSRFADVKRLVEAKQRQGLTISLCLPTLNEAATIGKEIVLLKSALKDQVPLLDEIAVIDSGSTDATRDIAASFRADVYLADEHLPECGRHRGRCSDRRARESCRSAGLITAHSPRR